MEHSRARLILKLVKNIAENHSLDVNNSVTTRENQDKFKRGLHVTSEPSTSIWKNISPLLLGTNKESELLDLERKDGKSNTPDDLHSTDSILLGETGTTETESPLKELDINIMDSIADTTRLRNSTIPGNFEDNESLNDFSSDDSLKDPHYCVSSSSASSSCSTSSSSGSPTILSDGNDDENEFHDERLNKNEKLGRKRKANPLGSIKEQAKRLRNMGKAYQSNSRKNKKVVAEKKMGPPCTDNNCKLQCYLKIPYEQRHEIFSAYWNLGNLQRQREFLSSNIMAIHPKYSYRAAESNRGCKNAFYFTVDERKIRVCKVFFRSTLSITDRPIRTVLSKRKESQGGILSLDLRGKHGNNKTVDSQIKQGIRQHISNIPRIDSHYCRADTSRQYIDGGKSIADLHRDYIAECRLKNAPYGNYVLYHRIFTSEFNLTFFQPKKDQCEDCTAFLNADDERKLQLQSGYDIHQREKILSRQEKERDKNEKNDSSIVAVYDLQAALPCPRGDVSNYYYVSKINTLNFTIYNLKTSEVQCFVWHEGEGNRGVNEIGSCVFEYLKSLEAAAENQEKLDVIFYSDNCCGQQKNHFMIAMYLYAVSNFSFLNSITHKFLIKGHTQNKGDSVHSVIERRIKRTLKSGPIYTPDQYINLIRTAKQNKNSYKVQEMNHESFYDIKTIASEMCKSFPTKNTENQLFKLSETKIIRVESQHPRSFLYKNSYSDTEYYKVEIFNKSKRRSNRSDENTRDVRNPITIKKVYKHKLSVCEKKKNALINLIKKQYPNSINLFMIVCKVIIVLFLLFLLFLHQFQYCLSSHIHIV